MDRSGSQKVLKIVSIIQIVFGVLTLITGLMTTVLGGFMGSDVEVAAEAAASGIDPTAVGPMVAILGVVVIVSALVSILQGVFGVRGANDPSKIMPAWIFAIVGLIMGIVSLIMSIVNGTGMQNIITEVFSVAIDGVMFWICNNIKNQN